MNIYRSPTAKEEPNVENPKLYKNSKESLSANVSYNFKYIHPHAHESPKTKTGKTKPKHSETEEKTNHSRRKSNKKNEYSLRKKSQNRRIEKLKRELHQKGIKVDVKDSDIYDEGLVKNLMEIKQLVSLKNKSFSGEELEIIKKGKEIILQVGNKDAASRKNKFTKSKKKRLKTQIEGASQIGKPCEPLYTNLNIYSPESKNDRNSHPSYNTEYSTRQDTRTTLHGKQDIIDAMNKSIDFPSASGRKKENKKIERNMKRNSKRKKTQNSRRTNKRQTKKNQVQSKRRQEGKKTETGNLMKKVTRNSCVDMGNTSKSINYFDLYNGKKEFGQFLTQKGKSHQNSGIKFKKKSSVYRQDDLLREYTSCTSMPNTVVQLATKQNLNNINSNNNKFLKRFRRTVGVPSPSRILNNEQISKISKTLFKKPRISTKKGSIGENETMLNIKANNERQRVVINGAETALYSQKIVMNNITLNKRKKQKLDFAKKPRKNVKVRKISITHRSRKQRGNLIKQTKTFEP